MSGGDPGSRLPGRRSESEALEQRLQETCAGESRVLVLRREAGVGKTALLDFTASWVAGPAQLDTVFVRPFRVEELDDRRIGTRCLGGPLEASAGEARLRRRSPTDHVDVGPSVLVSRLPNRRRRSVSGLRTWAVRRLPTAGRLWDDLAPGGH
jgi:hypothetical protein